MTAIQPVEDELSNMIERDFYRTTLASISQKFEKMQTFINNLANDISSIDEFLSQLERDAEQGFDVGSSQETLLFQRSTLQIDLDFYQRMKEAYVRKIFEDLHNFTRGIVTATIEIEPNPLNRPEDELRAGKMGGVAAFEADADYSITDVYTLLNVTERNLFELGADIASFSVKIRDAQAKQERGFAIGNLLLNLESQRTKLTLEFKGYIMRIPSVSGAKQSLCRAVLEARADDLERDRYRARGRDRQEGTKWPRPPRRKKWPPPPPRPRRPRPRHRPSHQHPRSYNAHRRAQEVQKLKTVVPHFNVATRHGIHPSIPTATRVLDE